MLGDLRLSFPRSHVRRKSLIGSTFGLFSACGTVIDLLIGRQHPEGTTLELLHQNQVHPVSCSAISRRQSRALVTGTVKVEPLPLTAGLYILNTSDVPRTIAFAVGYLV